MSRFEFTLDQFRWLLSEAGQALLLQASQLDLRPEQQLKTLDILRRQDSVTREQAIAAYEMAVLRRHARTKFAHADAMYFTREALEQATGERVARHHAARFPINHIVCDLACSVGGDLLALAHRGPAVGIDRDPVRLAMAAANAEVLGLRNHITLTQADLDGFDLPECEGAFFDPARREGGRRLAATAYQPALSHIVRWRPGVRVMGVKVAPGVDYRQMPLWREMEIEFISVDGEVKEAVLWYGDGAQVGQRATLIQGDATYTLHNAGDLSPLPISPPLAYLYEPDGAILRAGLVAAVGAQLGAAQLDPEIAYLTAERHVRSPFARCWRVVEWLPFQLKHLKAVLRGRGVGAVTVKKRGSPIDTDRLARELSGDGDWPCVVVLTQHVGKPIVIVAEGPV